MNRRKRKQRQHHVARNQLMIIGTALMTFSLTVAAGVAGDWRACGSLLLVLAAMIACVGSISTRWYRLCATALVGAAALAAIALTNWLGWAGAGVGLAVFGGSAFMGYLFHVPITAAQQPAKQ